METKILNNIFIALIVAMVILLLAIVLINVEEEGSNVGRLPDITGAMQSYDVYHGNSNPQYVNVKTSERFDDKFFEYLEGIQEARDRTFMRGRVFLREK